MFVDFDSLLKQHTRDIADSLRQQEERVSTTVAEATAKRMHSEHEELSTHHFKNSFVAMDHILRSTTHENLEANVRSMTELTTTGILTCMRTKAFKLLQYGEYQPLLQWLHVRDEVNRLTAHHGMVEVEVPDGLMIRTDETMIKIILQNLASNAMKHGRHDGVVGISFSVDSGKVIILVTNEPGTHHETMLEIYGSPSNTAAPSDAFSALLKHSGEKASSGNTFSQGMGLNGIKQCLDTLDASMSLHFHTHRVEAAVMLTIDSKFFAKTTFDGSPVIACLDDSAVQRKLLQRICSKTKASSGSFSAGASIAEILAFPMNVVGSSTPVTHCIIDQNLDDPVGAHQCLYGTDIVKQLRKLGYAGRCIMRSANDSPEYVALYRECGADAFMSKSALSPAAFVEALAGKKMWEGAVTL
jgi:anti-sigma regulatory factor (Ser/Thr protein kinase)